MREIRLILQKNDLSIAKCTRKKWGKYTLASMKQGEFEQVEADVVIAKGYFKYKKEMIKNKQAEIKERVILANERFEKPQLIGKKEKDVEQLDLDKLLKNRLLDK